MRLKSTMLSELMPYTGPIRNGDRVANREAVADALAKVLFVAFGADEARAINMYLTDRLRDRRPSVLATRGS